MILTVRTEKTKLVFIRRLCGMEEKLAEKEDDERRSTVIRRGEVGSGQYNGNGKQKQWIRSWFRFILFSRCYYNFLRIFFFS